MSTGEDNESLLARRLEREVILCMDGFASVRLDQFDANTLAEIIAQFVRAEIAAALTKEDRSNG